MKFLLILIFFFVNLNASMVFSCFTEFVIHEGKRYSSPDNMKKVIIKFSDDKNILVFKTQNGQSHYNY